MVDVRMPERWLNDRRILLLSDSEFRTFVVSMMWAVANRTDGVITADDLTLMPRATTSAVLRFTDLGLWTACEPESDGWLIEDFAATQTSKHDLEVLENARRRDREKKQRQRSSKSDGGHGPSFGAIPGDVPGDASPGQDRQAGKAGQEGHVVSAELREKGERETKALMDKIKNTKGEWPTARIGQRSA